MRNMPPVLDIKNEGFIKALTTETTKVYFVGGCVRDLLLGEKAKDIDLVVTGIDMPELVTILKKYGKADLVGESFGVIKFTPKDCENSSLKEMGTIDIAIPRVEISTGSGHKDFQVVASADVTLEDDLLRRDFTINSIAMDMNGKTIDPFDGFYDLLEGTLHCTSTRSFSDDPLRILRAFRFAARFKMHASYELVNLIGENIESILNITPERIHEEFKKVFESCDNDSKHKYIGMLYTHKVELNGYKFDAKYRNATLPLNTFADFVTAMFVGKEDKDLLYLKVLKGEISVAKDVKALSILRKGLASDKYTNKVCIIDAYKISDIGDRSDYYMSPQLLLFRNRVLPPTLKEIAIKGDKVKDILVFERGHSVNEVGLALARIHQAVVLGSLVNTVEAGVWFLENNYIKKVVPAYQQFQNEIMKSRDRPLTPEQAWSRITG